MPTKTSVYLQILNQNLVVQEEAITRSIKSSLSPQHLFLECVLFLLYYVFCYHE